MLKRMKNTDPGFYGYMGKIFGSRRVQRDTSDRFYDDDEKEWIAEIKNKSVAAVVSVKNDKISNVYADDIFALIEILKSISGEITEGIVPIAYREAYTAAGYQITGEKKNFLTIKGRAADE